MFQAILRSVLEFLIEAYTYVARPLIFIFPMGMALLALLEITRDPEQYRWVPKALWITPIVFAVLMLLWFLLVSGIGREFLGTLRDGNSYWGYEERMEEERSRKSRKKADQTRVVGDNIPEWKFETKNEAAKAILKFFDLEDPQYNYAQIRRLIEATIQSYREVFQEGSTLPIKKYVSGEMLASLNQELKTLKKVGEQVICQPFEVIRWAIFRIDFSSKVLQPTFHVIAKVKSREYVQDVETSKIIRGLTNEWVVQHEAWEFVREEKRWCATSRKVLLELDESLDQNHRITQEAYELFRKSHPQSIRSQVSVG